MVTSRLQFSKRVAQLRVEPDGFDGRRRRADFGGRPPLAPHHLFDVAAGLGLGGKLGDQVFR